MSPMPGKWFLRSGFTSVYLWLIHIFNSSTTDFIFPYLKGKMQAQYVPFQLQHTISMSHLAKHLTMQ